MCGRYSFVPTQKQLEEDLKGVETPPELPFRYNIAPTQQAYVLTSEEPHRLQPMEWGLVPHWSKDGKNTGKLINARAEGLAEKPSFRNALKRRRCLVPADSFYEWRKGAAKQKIPYRIKRRDGRLLFLAGLWEIWGHGPEAKRTFTIVTTTPSTDVAPLHDRMPVVLDTPEKREAWLKGSESPNYEALLQPTPSGFLDFYRVSEKLNSPSNDATFLHDQVPESEGLF